MITLDRITFGYANRAPVLRDLSLSVSAGESVCIMGSNGCGKSTLARILAGLTSPQSGTVRIDIAKPIQISGAHYTARPVGILFQNPDNQMVAVTVEKEIAFALENIAMPLSEMEAKVAETLNQFGIAHLRTRLTSELSGGEKQRVALAAVMVSEPPIIVLDEPDSFLDEKGKELLRVALGQMHSRNHDLIELRITQYPDIARTYKRLVVLHDSNIVADGNPCVILNDEALCVRAGLKYAEIDGLNFTCFSERQEADTSSKSPKPFPHATALCLTNLSFEYVSGSPIISSLNFEWKRGETLGLVGDSGSGKSTLGLLLCGLLKPTTGKIELLDGNCTVNDSARIAGAVVGSFQQPERQFFLPTCAEEIAFGPKNRGTTLSREEISEYLTMVGLDPLQFSGRDPFSLSMGEQRRLAFAAILSMKPSFILFDEPTCGLDPEGVGRFTTLSRNLKRSGISQIIISHDNHLICDLCDRVISLGGEGRSVELDIRQFKSQHPSDPIIRS